ncbi:MAG: methyl-accepting chemotaxis protein [Dechloromonas sp.]|nr:methyl-accepting chemotaxis protein [Dechloromonas sp.]
MRITLSTKLYAATIGALLIMLLFVSVNIYSNRASHGALTDVYEHTVQPLISVQEIDNIMDEIRFRVLAVSVGQLPRAGSRIHLKENRARIPEHWKIFTNANKGSSPEEIELIQAIDRQIAALPALFDRIDRFYDADDREALAALVEDEWPAIISKLQKPLGSLIELENAAMRRTYEASAQLGQRLNWLVIGVFAAAVAIMLIGAVVIVRSISRPAEAVRHILERVAAGDMTVHVEVSSKDEIGDMAASLNTAVKALNRTLASVRQASRHLSETSDSLSAETQTVHDVVDRQTESVMQISAGMQQLTVSVAEVSKRTLEIADASQRTRQIAHDSVAEVDKNTATTQRALQAATASSNAVGELSAEIERINEMTSVIKEIADQTNLLALNAAIEAARAGESGRGFAVVADEVRKLAERTAHSTADINQMVHSIQSKAHAAVDAMSTVSSDVEQSASQTGQLHDSFARILDAAGDLSRLADDIANTTAEQSKVAQQTACSMDNISRAAEQTGESVSQVAAKASDTARTALELRGLVEHFQVAG